MKELECILLNEVIHSKNKIDFIKHTLLIDREKNTGELFCITCKLKTDFFVVLKLIYKCQLFFNKNLK